MSSKSNVKLQHMIEQAEYNLAIIERNLGLGLTTGFVLEEMDEYLGRSSNTLFKRLLTSRNWINDYFKAICNVIKSMDLLISIDESNESNESNESKELEEQDENNGIESNGKIHYIQILIELTKHMEQLEIQENEENEENYDKYNILGSIILYYAKMYFSSETLDRNIAILTGSTIIPVGKKQNTLIKLAYEIVILETFVQASTITQYITDYELL